MNVFATELPRRPDARQQLATGAECRLRHNLAHSRPSKRARSSAQLRPTVLAVDSSDSDIPLSDLKDRLELAIRTEDYKSAATLRDELQLREHDVRAAVKEANRRFYKAFEDADMKAMTDIWGTGEHVQVLHPGAHNIVGREGVLESWRLIVKGTYGMRISLKDVLIYAGDDTAFVTCLEIINSSEERGCTAATNIFEKQEGRWVLVHHQGGLVPPTNFKIDLDPI